MASGGTGKAHGTILNKSAVLTLAWSVRSKRAQTQYIQFSAAIPYRLSCHNCCHSLYFSVLFSISSAV